MEPVVHDEAFDSERQVAQVTEQGHFENVPAVHIRHRIDPFRQAVEIPELPEKSADERGDSPSGNPPPVAARELRPSSGTSCRDSDAARDPEWRGPQGGEKLPWPDAREHKP